MFRHARTVLAATLTTAAVAATTVLSAAPANAAISYPGAGFVVRGVTGMATTLTVPTITCTSGENSAVVLGLMGTQVGTAAGWNAAAVAGCANGHAWYRIQTWVNALGGGHAVAPASAGDRVQCRIIYANTTHPLLRATNLTQNIKAEYRLKVPMTTAVVGAYAGAFVPKFANPWMDSMANHKPLSKMDRTRKDEMRNGRIIIESSHLSSNGYDHQAIWRSH